jgi:hypothetical protein
MKIRNDKNEEWKSDNVSNETGNNTLIKSEGSGRMEIKITLHRLRQRRKNGSGS